MRGPLLLHYFLRLDLFCVVVLETDAVLSQPYTPHRNLVPPRRHILPVLTLSLLASFTTLKMHFVWLTMVLPLVIKTRPL